LVQAGQDWIELNGRREVETVVFRVAFNLEARLRPVEILGNRVKFQYRTRVFGSSPGTGAESVARAPD
jgi:hypothetical protein